MTKFVSAVALAAAATFAFNASAFACATCGCCLDTDAANGYGTGEGWRIDLQYNYINQDQLRHGGNSTNTSTVASTNGTTTNANGSQEVEKDTLNRYVTLGVTYKPSLDWGIAVQTPYIVRGHQTYGNVGTNELDNDNLSGVHYAALGDIRVIGTYQGVLENRSLGLEFGVKLPTGRFGGTNTDTGATVGHPYNFGYGPNAGSSVDTSLQPGNGSTDVILGAFYFQPISQDFDAFVNGRFQMSVLQELDSVNQNYRPGNAETFTFGVRYENTPLIIPQLQVNITHKSADQGALADTADTAGTVAYISPGVTVHVVDGVNIFAFVQVPVASYLDGYQLFPHWTGNAGVSYAF